jgi:hypothetical protein
MESQKLPVFTPACPHFTLGCSPRQANSQSVLKAIDKTIKIEASRLKTLSNWNVEEKIHSASCTQLVSDAVCLLRQY